MVFRSASVKYLIAVALFGSNAVAEGITIAELNAGDGISFQLKQACASHMCGPVPSQRAIHPRLEKAFLKVFSERLVPGLSKWMDLIVADKRQVLEAEKRAATLNNVKLPSEFKILVNFFWSLKQFEKVSDYTAAVDGKLVLKDSFKTVLKNLSESEYQMIRVSLDLMLNSDEYKLNSALADVDLDSAFMKVFSDQVKSSSVAQVKKNYALEAVHKLQRLQKLLPNIKFATPRALSNLAQGKDITPGEIKIVADTLRSLPFVNLFEGHRRLFESREPNYKTMIAENLSSKEYANFKTQLATATNLKTATLFRCRGALQKALTVHVTPKQIEKAKLGSEQARSSVIAQIKKQFAFDQQLVSQLVEAVQSARFRFPLTSGELIAQVRAQIADAIRTERISAEQKIPREVSDVMSLATGPDSDFYEDVEKICNQMIPEAMSDNARTSLGLISVGWESVQNIEVGRATMAHELGHVVFAKLASLAPPSQPSQYLLRISKLNSLKACLSSKHGVQASRPDSSDEDFADWLAAKVVVDLNSQGIPTKNMACWLLGGDGLSYGTINGLTLKWPASYNIDDHSPTLFRLLSMEVEGQNQLAPVCSDLLRNNMPREALQSCSL